MEQKVSGKVVINDEKEAQFSCNKAEKIVAAPQCGQVLNFFQIAQFSTPNTSL